MNPLFPSLLSFLALNVESAWALETGNMQGVVEDESGVPVPGAEVVLSGADIAGERRMTTSEDGAFRFDGLAPGTYEVTVLFKGATIARAEVRVALATTTNVPIPAKMGGISAEVEVIGFKPVIDTTSSSFSTSLGEESIQNLPVGRNFEDVVNTIPGVSGRIDTQNGGSGGSPSVRGEGGYGNNYMIDGVSTRDPATKTSGADINFDAIQEIQVYTDGAPAEYGQFTGMMVNVVTKDGGDEHHGSVAMFYSQHAWFNPEYDIYDPDEGKEVPTIKRKFRSPILNATAGGPLVKEKLWYFTALDLSYNWLRPEGLDEELDAIESPGGQFLGKVTWFPNSAWTLRYMFNGSYSPTSKWDAGPTVADEATTNRIDAYQSHRLTATLTPDDKNTLELRAGFLNQILDIVPTNDDFSIPSRMDASGVLRDNAYNADYNDRNRVGGGLIYTRFLGGLLGNHRIKAGAEYWTLFEKRDIVNTGQVEMPWINNVGEEQPNDIRSLGTRYQGGNGFPCEAADYSDCQQREHWTNVGPLVQRVNTISAFLQDDWQPSKALTVNAGVRLDIEDGRNNDGERPTTQIVEEFAKPPDQRSPEGTYGPAIMPAPRLGFALDPWKNGKTKMSGFYGQFYDLAGNNLWSWANSSSANGFIRFVNDGNGNYQWLNTQDPVDNPLIYAEDLLPARVDKVTVAIERELVDDFAMGLRGILSRTKNIPEDIDTNFDDWYIMNSPVKYRVYRGLELTANKYFDEVWQLFGAITVQESFGHSPGQFELASGATSGSDGNNVGVYLDDIGERDVRQDYYEGGPRCQASGLPIINGGCGWVLEALQGLGRYSPGDPTYYDEAGWFGYLPYHSFVAIKLNGSYTAPWGTKFGLVYEFDSGHAWEKKTYIGFYGYDGFAQGRGSRFMPPVHYVDARIAHQFGLGKEDRSLEATLDIFNVPGFAQSITYWTNDEPGFGSTLYRQSPRSIRLGLKLRY